MTEPQVSQSSQSQIVNARRDNEHSKSPFPSNYDGAMSHHVCSSVGEQSF